ncbi:histone-lysine N-methyltransferase SETMAR [Trichonephila clavipes]|nr:histone-lysine N-methyltransferase SETMAR [Trichonephila clavipes]
MQAEKGNFVRVIIDVLNFTVSVSDEEEYSYVTFKEEIPKKLCFIYQKHIASEQKDQEVDKLKEKCYEKLHVTHRNLMNSLCMCFDLIFKVIDLGRPSEIDSVLQSMLENNPHLTSQEIAEEFGIHHTTVGDHIKYLGFVLKRSVWVPHELTEKNLSDRVRMCSSHLIRHNVEPVLDKLITGDEKWILYENIKRKKSYYKPGTSSATFPKPCIHQRKVLLCLWWDRKGPVYFEFLKQGKTINADLYCNQLDKLNAAIKVKRPRLVSGKGILFHHDNARPHTARVTQQKLNALGWEVLGHQRIHLTLHHLIITCSDHCKII